MLKATVTSVAASLDQIVVVGGGVLCHKLQSRPACLDVTADDHHQCKRTTVCTDVSHSPFCPPSQCFGFFFAPGVTWMFRFRRGGGPAVTQGWNCKHGSVCVRQSAWRLSRCPSSFLSIKREEPEEQGLRGLNGMLAAIFSCVSCHQHGSEAVKNGFLTAFYNCFKHLPYRLHIDPPL